jgi:hypothetical protein
MFAAERRQTIANILQIGVGRAHTLPPFGFLHKGELFVHVDRQAPLGLAEQSYADNVKFASGLGRRQKVDGIAGQRIKLDGF